jgi:hypothetical protein
MYINVFAVIHLDAQTDLKKGKAEYFGQSPSKLFEPLIYIGTNS